MVVYDADICDVVDSNRKSCCSLAWMIDNKVGWLNNAISNIVVIYILVLLQYVKYRFRSINDTIYQKYRDNNTIW